MKKFRGLETAALFFEILTYLNLLTIGLMLIFAIINHDKYIEFSPMGIGVMLMAIVVALWYYWFPMSIANFIRLQISKYEVACENLEISKDILRELKSNNFLGEPFKESEFKMWKLNNPSKGINDFYAEKNS